MIIAIDFDGILCENKFPDIGKPNYQVITLVRMLIDKGHEVILWTSRVNEQFDAAVNWCEDRGLHFTTINDNAPSNIAKYGTNPRKIFADVYVDDHNIEYIMQDIKSTSSYEMLISYLTKGVKRWATEAK